MYVCVSMLGTPDIIPTLGCSSWIARNGHFCDIPLSLGPHRRDSPSVNWFRNRFYIRRTYQQSYIRYICVTIHNSTKIHCYIFALFAAAYTLVSVYSPTPNVPVSLYFSSSIFIIPYADRHDLSIQENRLSVDVPYRYTHWMTMNDPSFMHVYMFTTIYMTAKVSWYAERFFFLILDQKCNRRVLLIVKYTELKMLFDAISHDTMILFFGTQLINSVWGNWKIHCVTEILSEMCICMLM